MFTEIHKLNIVKKIALFLSVCLPILMIGQSNPKKIKGNKIIELKTQNVDAFNSIEVGNFFEVELVLKGSTTVSVDADSNLHEHIFIKVIDGKLKITTDKTFTRYKRLFVEVGVNSKLTDVFVKGKATLTAKNTLTPERLNIEVYENGKATLNYKVANASFFAKNKGEITVSGESDILAINVNDNAEIEANSICKSFSASQNLKSELTLNGKAENSILQIADNSFFNGANLVSGTTVLSASGDADVYINTTDKLSLEVTGKTNTYLLGNPLIDLKVFKDEATIYKTNKAPSTLKTFLK